MPKYTISGRAVTEEEFKQTIGNPMATIYLEFPFLAPNYVTTITAGAKGNSQKLKEGFEALEELKKSRVDNRGLENCIKSVTGEHKPKSFDEIWHTTFSQPKDNKKLGENSSIIPEGYTHLASSWDYGNNTIGKKETEGKLFYEFDWEFIEAAAKRMQENKGKYKPYNWKSSIDIEEIKQALNRHHIEVMKGNYKDGEDELGHVVSYMNNAMILWHQLKNFQNSLHNKK